MFHTNRHRILKLVSNPAEFFQAEFDDGVDIATEVFVVQHGRLSNGKNLSKLMQLSDLESVAL